MSDQLDQLRHNRACLSPHASQPVSCGKDNIWEEDSSGAHSWRHRTAKVARHCAVIIPGMGENSVHFILPSCSLQEASNKLLTKCVNKYSSGREAALGGLEGGKDASLRFYKRLDGGALPAATASFFSCADLFMRSSGAEDHIAFTTPASDFPCSISGASAECVK